MEHRDAAYQFLDLVDLDQVHRISVSAAHVDLDDAQLVREIGDGSEFRRFAASALCIAPLKSRTALLSMTQVELDCRLPTPDWSSSTAVGQFGGPGGVAAPGSSRRPRGPRPRTVRRGGKPSGRRDARPISLARPRRGACRSRRLSDQVVRVVVKVDGEHYRVDLTVSEGRRRRPASPTTSSSERSGSGPPGPCRTAPPSASRSGGNSKLSRRTLVPVPRAPLEIAAFPCNAPVTQYASRAFLEAAAGEPTCRVFGPPEPYECGWNVAGIRVSNRPNPI